MDETEIEVRRHEQHRIAQELHDGLGQGLSAASLLLRATIRSAAGVGLPIVNDLSEINSILDGAIVLCRGTVQGLVTSALTAQNLEAALVGLAQRKARIYQSPVDARIEKGVIGTLPGKYVREVFLLAQEAVRNACQHAAASLVVLSLSRVGNRIYLEITDNGSGPPRRRSVRKGMGIQIMRYHARQIGATLSVRKATPRGTLVRCVL